MSKKETEIKNCNFKYLILANMRFHVYICALMNCVSAYFVPLCKWSDLSTSRAKVFSVNGEEVAIMKRSYDQVVAFKDNCVHRGASFENAKVSNKTLICNYHAFEFSLDDGALQHGLGTTPNCTKLTNVPVVRRQNLIWGCLNGNMTTLPPPLQKHDFSKQYRRTYGSTWIRCKVNMLVENVLDPLHICEFI